MSAIYGIWRFDGTQVDPGDIDRMGATMAHRAIDGRNSFIDGAIGLGHGLARETREDAHDAQPLHDRDAGLILVADARIDNREALAELLAIDPTSLATLPDSALILHAYRRWGAACAAQLLGDFAFAIWDVAARKLVLGRDHMGQRYIHYHHGEGFFAFASEPKALLSLIEVPRALNDAAIARLLCLDFQSADGATMFQGITGLLGGTTLTIAADRPPKEQRYWTIGPDPAHLDHDDAYYVRTYRQLLAEAVACRVRRAIAPPGLLLSGGFDSSAIAALSGPALPPGMKLVTVTSALAPGSNDPRDARAKVEWCLQTMPHLDHCWFVRTTETPFDDFEQLCRALDRPPDPTCHVSRAFHQSLAARGCRVMMDGFGGDQTLNPRRHRALSALLARGRIGRFVREVRASAARENVPARSLAWIAVRQVLPRPARRWWRRIRHGPAAFSRNFYAAPPLLARMVKSRLLLPPDLLRLYERQDARALDVAMLHAIQRLPHPNQAIESASCGLLLTNPMLDKRIVAFGQAIPEHLHFADGRMRHLARLALQDILPPALLAAARGQEYFDPSFRDTVDGMTAAITDLITRMADNPVLNNYIDVDRLRADQQAGQLLDGPPSQALRLINTLRIARYIDWFDRQNR
ncbi:asparagine synthase-related protein [Sphingomonas sp. 28-63-12]|uniref:asparagine synthase-related protein n=1 Tax=Sphingomonas sp. 28-63-12 TaxID=1970434 RepID=UPI000BC7F061|nr:MAG: hypothetical protein B7Y47_06050 [Sphingomonas sp. 28-63-12]